MSWEIRQGDALSLLREMPDGIVQTCITSPPYWGLRDYGTAEWDGGDAECDHLQVVGKVAAASTLRNDGRAHKGPYEGEKATTTPFPFKDVCGKCGARRVDSQLGLEPTPDQYVQNLVEVFREVRRVLRDDGTVWLNLGDSYNAGRDGGWAGGLNGVSKPENAPNRSGVNAPGLKPKDLVGTPWRVAFALQADGWYLRSDIIWAKPNPMPESVRDRPTRSHEYIFLLSKGPRYFWDQEAVREPIEGRSAEMMERYGGQGYSGENPAVADKRLRQSVLGAVANGRNIRSVWQIATQPFSARKLGSARRVPVAPDEASDDTTRIPSPDCLVHGGSSGSVSTASDGEREGDDRSHTVDTDDYHVQEQLDGLVATDQHPEQNSDHGSSGLPFPADSPTATVHNTQTRKTDSRSVASGGRAVSETLDHIGHILPSSESPGPDGFDSPDLSQTPGSTPHKSTCTCEYYRLEQPDHFATFPEKLVEPCILAGSSPKACGECGAPWERVVERGELVGNDRGGNYKGREIEVDAAMQNRMAMTNGEYRPGMAYENKTTGWQPTCPHSDDSGQSLVLDPFAGSGTVGVVALRHGRSFLGLELNPTYVQLARHRIIDDSPLLNSHIEKVA